MSRGESSRQHRTDGSLSQIRAQPPRLRFFTPQPVCVGRPSYNHPPSSLLGIPPEVRDQIWEYIFNDIKSAMEERWFARPATHYDALYLVCRQVYHEIAPLWPICIVPKHRLHCFRNQTYSLSRLHGFKSLSIQIPFNMPGQFFSDVACLLKFLSPFLHHLNLSFVGQDAYGTQTFLHGCGNMVTPMTKTLPIDGQGFAERHTLINAIARLTNLRSLSIRNPNMPLMQSQLILQKPYLEKLHIECDPRSCLHIPWRVANCGYGLLLPVADNFPPVKELFISSNAAILSVQVVSKLKETLEKLTWLCPNALRWTGSMVPEVGRDTDIILRALSSHNHLLHTLRICIEDSITENSNDHGILIGSFRSQLPHLTSLRNLELHLCSRSPWFQTEILEALPPGLERLYLSDTLIKWDCLVSTIVQRTFGQNQNGESQDHADKLGIIITRDELARRDFIPMRNSALTFVSYQYRGAGNTCMVIKECQNNELVNDTEAGPLPELRGSNSMTIDEQCMALLKLNGRLLDRARNKHLAEWQPGAFISPNTRIASDQVTSDNDHPDIETALKHLHQPTLGEVRTNSTMLRIGAFQEDFDYFGEENAAEAVFWREQVMTAEMLEKLGPRTYPKEVRMGPKEHWICP